jgi:hypothetical protein
MVCHTRVPTTCGFGQRSVSISGTLRRKRNWRSPIFPVLNCTASALRSLVSSSWSFSTAFRGTGYRAYNPLPASFLVHEVVHCCWASFDNTIFLALLRWWANAAGFAAWFVSHSTILPRLFFFCFHPVACLAATSAISLPLMPICAGTQRSSISIHFLRNILTNLTMFLIRCCPELLLWLLTALIAAWLYMHMIAWVLSCPGMSVSYKGGAPHVFL